MRESFFFIYFYLVVCCVGGVCACAHMWPMWYVPHILWSWICLGKLCACRMFVKLVNVSVVYIAAMCVVFVCVDVTCNCCIWYWGMYACVRYVAVLYYMCMCPGVMCVLCDIFVLVADVCLGRCVLCWDMWVFACLCRSVSVCMCLCLCLCVLMWCVYVYVCRCSCIKRFRCMLAHVRCWCICAGWRCVLVVCVFVCGRLVHVCVWVCECECKSVCLCMCACACVCDLCLWCVGVVISCVALMRVDVRAQCTFDVCMPVSMFVWILGVCVCICMYVCLCVCLFVCVVCAWCVYLFVCLCAIFFAICAQYFPIYTYYLWMRYTNTKSAIVSSLFFHFVFNINR